MSQEYKVDFSGTIAVCFLPSAGRRRKSERRGFAEHGAVGTYRVCDYDEWVDIDSLRLDSADVFAQFSCAPVWRGLLKVLCNTDDPVEMQRALTIVKQPTLDLSRSATLS